MFASLGLAARGRGDTLTPYSEPALYDNGGKFMGHLLGYSPPALYLMFKMSSGEDIILPLVRKNGPLTWDVGTLSYVSNDCTGQAYSFGGRTAGDRFTVIGPGNVLYFLSENGTSSATVNSFYGPNGCAADVARGHTLYPMNPTFSLDSVFQMPFKIGNGSVQDVPAMNSWVMVSLALSLAACGWFVTRSAMRN